MEKSIKEDILEMLKVEQICRNLIPDRFGHTGQMGKSGLFNKECWDN